MLVPLREKKGGHCCVSCGKDSRRSQIRRHQKRASPYTALSSSTDITISKKIRLVVLTFFSLIEKKICFSQQHASKIRFGAKF
jgi:hypothetical protein